MSNYPHGQTDDQENASSLLGSTSGPEPQEDSTATELGPPTRLPPLPNVTGAKPYKFEDQSFAGRNGARIVEPFMYLAERCIAVDDGYLVETAGRWVLHKKATVIPALIQQHATEMVTADVIKEFLNQAVVKFEGDGLFPGGSRFVIYDKLRYLNGFKDTRLAGRDDAVGHAEHILRLIRENLCALPPASMEQMYEEATGQTPTIFRWVMHWLASVYKQPGEHIGTMLWFVGPNMGVGKGTLVQIMAELIGRQWVGKASAAEMGRGWNDFLTNCLLIEADEFETGSRVDLNRIFKQWIGNPQITINKRHVGAFNVPNVVNFIGTTNNIHPIQLDRNDRRHTLIQTTNDPSKNKLASDYHLLDPDRRRASLEGFAAILSAIQIDEPFIRKPFPTELRQSMFAWSLGPAERWFASADANWEVDTHLTAGQAYKMYKDWAEENDSGGRARLNETQFGKSMSSLASQGFIERRKASHSFYVKLKYYDPGTAEIVASSRYGGMSRSQYCGEDVTGWLRGDHVAEAHTSTPSD